MKRVKQIAICLFACVMMLSGVRSVKAAQDNQSISTAVELSSGKKHVDVVGDDSSDEKYYYVYRAKKSGYFTFTVGRNDYDSTDTPEWRVLIYDARMNEISSSYVEEKYTSQTIMVNKGDSYYVELYGCNSASKSTSYFVQADFKEYKYVEAEDNDSSSKATKLTLGHMYLGTMTNSDDEDYYKLTAAKAGVYKIHFDRHAFDSTDKPTWNFALFDSNMNQLYEINTDYNKDGIDVKYVLNKGNTIYIRISNYSGSKGEMYEIKSTYSAKKNIETEKNNSFSDADKIKTSTVYYGTLAERDSSDYFTMKASRTGNYKVTFSLEKDITFAQKVDVYDASHNRIASTGEVYKNGSIKFKGKRGARYYVVISHNSSFWGYSVGTLYKLKVTGVK